MTLKTPKQRKNGKEQTDKNPRASGRCEAEIDLEQLEKLCTLHPTDEEIAAHFNVCRETIVRKKKDEQFLQAMQNGFAKGRLSLRRAQFIKATTDKDTSMMIWLGKQLLGQKDKAQYGLDDDTRKSLEVQDANILSRFFNPTTNTK